jgi:hypothetical protein
VKHFPRGGVNPRGDSGEGGCFQADRGVYTMMITLEDEVVVGLTPELCTNYRGGENFNHRNQV